MTKSSTTNQPGKAALVRQAKRVVIKLGSSVVTDGSAVDRENVGLISAEIAGLARRGYEIVLVTSGARAAGLARLGLASIPASIPEQQAAAAIGQIALMSLYEEFLASFGRHAGQVLLTASDIENRSRYLNAKNTIEHLLAHGITPIVNENDSVAIDELKFGDNDRLSALVAGLVGADLLIILTDVDGVYDGDPKLPSTSLIPLIDDIDRTAVDTNAGSNLVGTGGMASKLKAAGSAAHRGIPTLIANGRTERILNEIMSGDSEVGTLVTASDSPVSTYKHWIAYGMPVKGTLVVDGGASQALVQRGSSLLPSGLVAANGNFRAGECVAVLDESGREIARGLATYDVSDCDAIKKQASGRIQEVLGYNLGNEIIHRDNLVILEELSNVSRQAAPKS